MLTTSGSDHSRRTGKRREQRRSVAGMCLDLYGLKVAIRTNRAEMLEPMLARLPTGCKPIESSQVDRVYSLWLGCVDGSEGELVALYRGSRRLVQSKDREEALAALEFDAELFVVENSPTVVFVHAGVVGFRGKTIVIPGKSYSGKSTLTAAMCRAGATYFSDEYALFDAGGRVHSYPRPLRLRVDPDGSLAFASDLTVGRAEGPLPLGLVILTRYQAGVRWQPRNITPGDALLALLANTMSARRRPEAVLTALQRALASARVVQGPRGEAEEMAAEVLQMAGD